MCGIWLMPLPTRDSIKLISFPRCIWMPFMRANRCKIDINLYKFFVGTFYEQIAKSYLFLVYKHLLVVCSPGRLLSMNVVLLKRLYTMNNCTHICRKCMNNNFNNNNRRLAIKSTIGWNVFSTRSTRAFKHVNPLIQWQGYAPCWNVSYIFIYFLFAACDTKCNVMAKKLERQLFVRTNKMSACGDTQIG